MKKNWTRRKFLQTSLGSSLAVGAIAALGRRAGRQEGRVILTAAENFLRILAHDLDLHSCFGERLRLTIPNIKATCP